MSRFTRFSLLALLIVLIVPAGFAQVSNTTGALIGHVTDQAGAILPGVTVTVTGSNLQGPRTAVTDAQGEYVLPLLPPGAYHAEYALSGIKSQVRDNITVSLQQKTEVNVQMQLAVTETVTVTASQVVIDPTQTTQQTNLKEDHLKYTAVGSANRSYQSVLQQAAGAAGGSNPQVAGANNAQNVWMLDGINTTDPVTHTFGGNLSFDAIQEISITTLGKDAEYGSSGGTVNVITKSGGNNFSGVADWRYNDKKLQTQGQDKKFVAPTVFGGPVGASSLRFDKNLQPAKSSQPALSVGGPLQRDRLWFFASLARPDTAITPANTLGFQPGTRTFKGWNNLGKLTSTPVSNQTVNAKFIDTYAKIPFAQQSSFVSPEADRVQTQGSRTYGIGYDAILSSKWLLNAQVGHTPARLASLPIGGDFTTPGVSNLQTGVSTGNFTNQQARTSTRNELLLNSTYYVEKFGTHAFKVGFDGNKTDFTSYNNSVGDPRVLTGFPSDYCSPANGFPSGAKCVGFIQTNPAGLYTTTGLGLITTRVVASVENPAHTVDSKSYAYFAQDEWNPMTRLTVRYGVRYEQVKWNSNSPAEPPDFKLFQPRLGAAYDIFNNASSVVHGYAGKIMDDNQLTLPNFGFQQPQGSVIFDQKPGATNVWVFNPLRSSISLSGGLYDPTLKPSYSNQWSIGFTQKIWRNTSLDVSAEGRKQKDLFEDFCGYVDAANAIHNLTCTITNHPGVAFGAPSNSIRSDYHAIISKIEARPYQWLDVLTSWTHAQSKGSTESTQNQNTAFDYYPANFINQYGFLSDDAKNRVKFDGYVHLPLDFTVGMNYYWDDGLPWSVTQTASVLLSTGYVLPGGTYFIEPRGSRRLPHFTQTDVQVQKDFRLGTSKIGLIFSVLNLLNAETITGVNGNAGSRAAADSSGHLIIDPDQVAGKNRLAAGFSQPTSFQRPRRYEVGIRFEY